MPKGHAPIELLNPSTGDSRVPATVHAAVCRGNSLAHSANVRAAAAIIRARVRGLSFQGSSEEVPPQIEEFPTLRQANSL